MRAETITEAEWLTCTDAAIPGHCRPESGHVRGCWVLDLLLGRE
ncbi:hypothetical protein ElP_32240 [Tautonia plasticadhaerens]|uniref:Uncharacterized protein n=1 Tax=Tautonia plasticadhaerens TaxID=2527974 RepID=A0A518H3A4_9BACT|nr:hypothetical protein ElP_32240 [Tautonia plasticadhaerens]